ncbi:MAG: hypothetical protein ACJ0FN_00140 [Gammaproteobacteria bacterium]|jgi:hypothetical protein|tara:strand:- start:918 stop:1295 length:378 start_codon:yes stop_codon:yes gene_type:complete
MDLNNNNQQTTVIIDVSFSEHIDIVKEFILNEQCPFVNSQADEGLIKFEWFLDESNKTGTLIEVFANPVAWEDLANKVIGTPVNVKFGEMFNIEGMTVLGKVTDAVKEKIKAMNPIIKNYIGGIN